MWKTIYYLNCRYELLFADNQCKGIQAGNEMLSAEYYRRHQPILFLALMQLARQQDTPRYGTIEVVLASC